MGGRARTQGEKLASLYHRRRVAVASGDPLTVPEGDSKEIRALLSIVADDVTSRDPNAGLELWLDEAFA